MHVGRGISSKTCADIPRKRSSDEAELTTSEPISPSTVQNPLTSSADDAVPIIPQDGSPAYIPKRKRVRKLVTITPNMTAIQVLATLREQRYVAPSKSEAEATVTVRRRNRKKDKKPRSCSFCQATQTPEVIISTIL